MYFYIVSDNDLAIWYGKGRSLFTGRGATKQEGGGSKGSFSPLLLFLVWGGGGRSLTYPEGGGGQKKFWGSSKTGFSDTEGGGGQKRFPPF